MDRRRVTDADFEVIEAPHGMTWRQYEREQRRQQRLQDRAGRPLWSRILAPKGWAAEAEQLRIALKVRLPLLGLLLLAMWLVAQALGR